MICFALWTSFLPDHPGDVDVHTLGRLKSGGGGASSFPVSLKLRRLGESETKIRVSVYHSLSGLVVLNSAGRIESANPHFVNMLFGYSGGGGEDLKGKGRMNSLHPVCFIWDSPFDCMFNCMFKTGLTSKFPSFKP